MFVFLIFVCKGLTALAKLINQKVHEMKILNTNSVSSILTDSARTDTDNLTDEHFSDMLKASKQLELEKLGLGYVLPVLAEQEVI